MKQRFLLLGAALLMGAQAFAQFTLNREKPAAPQFSDWKSETPVYLYNEHGGFLANHQGAYSSPFWGTRTVTCDTLGVPFTFTRTNPLAAQQADEASEIWGNENVDTENAWLMTSPVKRFSGDVRCTFADGWSSIWVDNNENAHRFFNVTVAADKSIQIEGNDAAINAFDANNTYVYAGHPLAALEGDADRLCYLADAESWHAANADATTEPVFYSKWYVVSEADYAAYIAGAKTAMTVIAEAEALKAKLQAAMAANAGIESDAAFKALIAVYNDAAATPEALREAASKINDVVIAFSSSKATVDNPVDFSNLLPNPNFDGHVFDGWKGSGWGAGGTVSDCAEKYDAKFDTYAVVTGLAAGVYGVEADAFSRKPAGDAQQAYDQRETTQIEAYLYMATINGAEQSTYKTTIHSILDGAVDADPGVNSSSTITTADGGAIFTPNTMKAATDFYFTQDTKPYHSTVLGVVAEGDTVRVGGACPNSGSWNIYDSFQLKYYGNSDAAYAPIKQSVLEANQVDMEGKFYSKPDYDAYRAAYDALSGSDAKDVIVAQAKALPALRDSLMASLSAYADLVKAAQSANDWLTSHESSAGTKEYMLLSDYITLDDGDQEDGVYPNGVLRTILPTYDEGEGAGTLTTAQVKAEIAYIAQLKDDAIRHALEDGSDLTELIKNPGFEIAHGATGDGWLLDSSKGGTSGLTNWHGGNAKNYCAEAFQQNFDVYQEVENLPAGLYEVSVQAFYRTGANAEAEAAYDADPECKNEAKVYSEVYFNDLATPVKNVMSIRYESGELDESNTNTYTTSDGKYTLDGMTSASNAFSLEDESRNFTQKVYGLVTDGKMRLGIRRLVTPPSNTDTWTLWDNFKLTYRAKNEDVSDEIISSYADRIDATDLSACGEVEAEALPAALAAAQAATGEDGKYEAIIPLVAAFNAAQQSINAYKELYDKIKQLGVTCDNAVCDPATQAKGYDLLDEMNAVGYAKPYTELAALIQKMDDMIAQLNVPSTEGATFDTPIDVTTMIVNPDFETGNANGWTDSFTQGNHGYQGASYANEDTEDEQAASISKFAEAWRSGAALDNGAITQAIKLLPEGAYLLEADMIGCRQDDDTKDGGVYLYAQEDGQAAALTPVKTKNGAPRHYQLYFSKKAAETLVTIGLKVIDTEYNWTCVDNFKMSYLGSADQEAFKAVGISSVSSEKSAPGAIYNVSGQRQRHYTSGLNIIRQADGTVKKVYIK